MWLAAATKRRELLTDSMGCSFPDHLDARGRATKPGSDQLWSVIVLKLCQMRNAMLDLSHHVASSTMRGSRGVFALLRMKRKRLSREASTLDI